MTYITISEQELEQSNQKLLKSISDAGLDRCYSELSAEESKQRHELCVANIEEQINTSYRNIGKGRANLLIEGAQVLEKIGAESGFITNWSKDRGGYGYYKNQEWYLLKEDGKWYFKQNKAYKTKHLIMEVVA